MTTSATATHNGSPTWHSQATAAPKQTANPIVAVKTGEKEHPWEVDGITGATISSVAIANLLNNNASYWVPRLRANLDDFRKVE